jgi:hypothetical protein
VRPSYTLCDDGSDIDGLESSITSRDSFCLVDRIGDLEISLLPSAGGLDEAYDELLDWQTLEILHSSLT